MTVLCNWFHSGVLCWSIYSNIESINGIKYNEIFMVQGSRVVKGFEYIIQGMKWYFELWMSCNNWVIFSSRNPWPFWQFDFFQVCSLIRVRVDITTTTSLYLSVIPKLNIDLKQGINTITNWKIRSITTTTKWISNPNAKTNMTDSDRPRRSS